jgi:putative molybdopterin biosynthesis protein
MRRYYLQDIPLDEAQARLWGALERIGQAGTLPAESVPLSQAYDRVTAAPVFARLSAPHYHASGMDGYALHAANTHTATETRPVRLTVGQDAYPVNTGDPLPAGCDAVVMIEVVQEGDGAILVNAPVPPYQHVRMMGEDIVTSELVLAANHRIRAADLGALAGSGHATVNVIRRARVVIVPTGSELVSAAQAAEGVLPGQIIEYNSLVLAAQCTEVGALAETLPITPDDPTALAAALDEAIRRQPNLILFLSGSSAGNRDYTAATLEARGELLVHGVAVRPGHPVIIGLADGLPVIGVPGYPVSAALTGEIFVQPILARWAGRAGPLELRPRVQATLTRKLTSPSGDDDFVRVTLAQVGERLLATPLNRGAGVITSLMRADGLAHIPRFQEGAEAGQAVTVIAYRDPATLGATAALIGSHDPMLDLLAQFCGAGALTSAHVGSLGGLVALKRGEAHMAGIHLLDPETGEYNLAAVRKTLPSMPVQVVTFAYREQGMITAPSNPHGLAGWDDLARVRFVNRQRGSGTRLLIDYELAQRGITPEQVQGYTHEEYTHLAVAVAVQSGLADVGIGVRSAAVALGLDFIPVGWERYDFVIPQQHMAHPSVKRILGTLQRADFHAALDAQPGYSARETGQVIYPPPTSA